MAQPMSTPPPSATSFVSSTPTASLRSSATVKRVSIVSLHPESVPAAEVDHPHSSRNRRIEKWLQQQCDGFLAWEHERDKRAEMRSTEDGVQPQLRHAQSSRTLLTTCNSTTPVTNASFSWESDPLLSASPTTPSSSPAAPFAPSSNFLGAWNPLSNSQFQPSVTRAHPETEAARADSPLLGFPGLAVNELTAPTELLDTISEGKENALDGAKPLNVDKPLPPPPSTPSAIASIEAPASGPAPEQSPRGSNPQRAPHHSPTSSYSSSTSSRQLQRSLSLSNAQLPIGVAHPHQHGRTPSGSSSKGRVSRSSSFASSVQPVVTLSMATLAPIRREETTARSTLSLFASTRTRSHSNAIPSSMKQFHLPTGMIHRSQSHAQLRDGIPVPSAIFSPLRDLRASKGPSHSPMASSSLPASGGTGVVPRLLRKLSKPVVCPPISRTHSSTPSVSVASKEVREEVGNPVSHSHIRQASEILDRLESRVPSLSSSFSRNAVYIDSEDISARLDELLMLAKEEMESRVVEEDEGSVDTIEEGKTGGEQWIDMKGHIRGESINQQIPPNSPVTGYFGSALSVAGSQAASASGGGWSGAGFYASPEAGSSQVYLGSNPISPKQSIEQLNIAQNVEHLPPILPPQVPPSEVVDPDATIGELHPVLDSVPQQEADEAFPAADIRGSLLAHTPTPTPPERMDDEEVMEDALAFARELAVEDRMVWGVRGSLEIFDDCWSEFEDEEMGVGVCAMGGVPVIVGPEPDSSACEGTPAVANDQEGRVRFTLGGDGRDIRGGLAPPSASKWSLTSSVDEEKRMSLDGKPKKEKKRRSFVPFIMSGDKDKDKEPKEDSNHKENGTLNKKRNRLASFISRLSSVGLGGSGTNTPSTRTPPIPTLSASNSSHALSASKWDSPSLPALTPNFSATPSRSSSPTALLDPPQFRQPPQVTIVADDDRSDSSPSSSRLIFTSYSSSTYDSATPSPISRLPTPPPQTIPIPPMIFRRLVPPGIVIPPLPTRPPPELPSGAPPLAKAASESMINADSAPLMSRPRSNSAADLLGRHVTFTSSLQSPSSWPRIEQASMTPPSSLRRSVLAKSASASALGLHQQLTPQPHGQEWEQTGCYDDGLVPPTPSSIISTEEYGEIRRREDFYDDGHGYPKRPRLRAMSSLGSLPLSGTVNPGPPRAKGGFKGFVGRLTGRGKITTKASPVQIHIPPSFLGHDNSTRDVYPDLPTPIATYTPSPKHSPSASFSATAGGGNQIAAPGVGGVLSGFKSYLERTPFRQA